ncbi:MAG: SpoVG family protein [Candidatus Omnitrophica bacterium]|nr:SpoVG family protein [Candidatus Omnitrophota bacterium]MBU4303090.1 SpoVG family protein [Candidatus Omnitrophota bacterium]MBU4468227.1 SpoVG family protein [Candidatus Omnitrophota bacterium]MCG2707255.1 SpoVG family protein [Candidatus Omnitrophota bacterium]
MEITEVRIILKDSQDKKLKAYATVTFDNVFVVRDIKVIEGGTGLFIAMPSRKVKHACPKCAFKNELRSKYCNQCAVLLPVEINPQRAEEIPGSQAEHRDIAHPITQSFREYLQKKVLEVYAQEKAKVQTGSVAE